MFVERRSAQIAQRKHEAEQSSNNSFNAGKREEGVITCSDYIVLKNANPKGSAGRTSRMKA